MSKVLIRGAIISLFFLNLSVKTQAQHGKNIVAYIEAVAYMMYWPHEPQKEFVITVFGETTVLNRLTKKYARKRPKKIRRQPVKLVTMRKLSDYVASNIIYTEIKDPEYLKLICEDLKTTKAVIITLVPGFTDGPTINLDLDNNYHFQINQSKIEAKNITIGPVLLELGEIL